MKKFTNTLLGTVCASFFVLGFCTPIAVFAAITDPADGQVINDDNTAFLISGTAVGAANRWIIYAPNGDYICEDYIASPWNTFSMQRLKLACGTSAVLGNGAYHMLLHTTAYSPGCQADGSLTYCAATIGATSPICLDVGNTGVCVAGPSPSPSPSPTPTPAPAPVSTDPIREGTINVVTVVVNDNGGSKKVADFPLSINGLLVISGVTNTFAAPALPYVITETNTSNYTSVFSGDCDLGGYIGLNPGENKFCIITNDDIGVPTVVPPIPPLIELVKVAYPLALPLGPGEVTYTYLLRNIGLVPVTNIKLVGDTCSPITLVSFDNSGNVTLGVNKTWTYRCSATLSETHTNTVVATVWANGISAVDIASATVVVGIPIVPPLIHVTKVPSPLALPAGGGMVTYTKKVTNPGMVALRNIRLADDMCGPVSYISGDTNNDAMLDTTETWIYTCQEHLTKTTTNTVTVSGEANNLTAKDVAIATVVVAPIGLPNTGSTFGDLVRTITVDLRQGMRGYNVTILQQFLIAQNKGPAAYTLAQVGATAYFGDLTRRALAEFQAYAGIIPPVGYFGTITRSYLRAHNN
jgi:hypothetical protein